MLSWEIDQKALQGRVERARLALRITEQAHALWMELGNAKEAAKSDVIYVREALKHAEKDLEEYNLKVEKRKIAGYLLLHEEYENKEEGDGRTIEAGVIVQELSSLNTTLNGVIACVALKEGLYLHWLRGVDNDTKTPVMANQNELARIDKVNNKERLMARAAFFTGEDAKERAEAKKTELEEQIAQRHIDQAAEARARVPEPDQVEDTEQHSTVRVNLRQQRQPPQSKLKQGLVMLDRIGKYVKRRLHNR